MEQVIIRGRQIGKIFREKSAFLTERQWTKHYFKLFKGFGINEKLLKRLYDENITELWFSIELEDGKNELWKIKTEDALLHGNKWRNYTDIQDNQIIIPEERFEKP